MNEEFNYLKTIEEKLNYLYAKANTKSKKKRIMYDLLNFSETCHKYFEIKKTFIWEKDLELHQLLTESEFSFRNITSDNIINLDKISDNIIKMFKEMKYPFYKTEGKLLNSLTKAEVKDIVLDFLSKYDPKLIGVFNRKLENNEILCADLEQYTHGFVCPIDILNTNLIFLSLDLDYSCYYADIILHEFGHSYEDDIVRSTGVLGSSIRASNSFYQEVSSKFFEYAFLNYLKENRIYKDDSEILLNRYYVSLLEYMYVINIISKMKNIKEEDDKIIISDNATVNYGNKIREDLNYYNLPSELNTKLYFKNAFIYGLGTLFSIYLYENYKNNPNDFKKEFKNAMINYTNIGMDAFERVGVTEDKLLEGKVLKRVLRETLIK